jgi:hypothetical protein
MTTGSGASSLLRVIENILPLATLALNVSTPLASIMTVSSSTDGILPSVVYTTDPYRSVIIPDDITGLGSIHLSMIDLPSLALSLPPPPGYANVTSVQSVWSVHLSLNGSTVTNLNQPVNITFPHPPEVGPVT